MTVQSETLWPDGRPSWCDPGDIAARRLDGDEWLVIRPMIYSVRLAVMDEYSASIEHWCFPTATHATLAWVMYPDVPTGWSRWHRRDHTEVHP